MLTFYVLEQFSVILIDHTGRSRILMSLIFNFLFFDVLLWRTFLQLK